VKFIDLMRKFPDLLPQKETGSSSWFGFAITLTGRLVGRRAELVRILDQFGVQSRPVVAGNFTRNTVMKYLKTAPIGSSPNSDYVHDNSLFMGNNHHPMDVELQTLSKDLEALSI